MTPEQRTRAWVALAIGLSACFTVLVHLAVVSGLPRAAGALLSLVPVSLLALWLARRSRRRAVAFAIVATAAAGIWFGWDALERHFPGIFFVEHAGANLLLAWMFGRTLVPGREALVTMFARLVHGELPPDVVRYTRQVTLAWTIFFAAIFVASCALYLGGHLAAWSMLANIVSPLLVAAMFVVEYALRSWLLPDHERVGILGGIRAFTRHFNAARFEAPR